MMTSGTCRCGRTAELPAAASVRAVGLPSALGCGCAALLACFYMHGAEKAPSKTSLRSACCNMGWHCCSRSQRCVLIRRTAHGIRVPAGNLVLAMGGLTGADSATRTSAAELFDPATGALFCLPLASSLHTASEPANHCHYCIDMPLRSSRRLRSAAATCWIVQCDQPAASYMLRTEPTRCQEPHSVYLDPGKVASQALLVESKS